MTVNTEKIEKILMDSTFEVFEKMFYISLEALNADHKVCDIAAIIGLDGSVRGEGDIAVTINFDGSVRGEGQISLSGGMTEMMAQNMLSLDACEITEKDIEDCSKEAANMIWGNFLRKFNADEAFNLSIPIFGRNPGTIRYQGPDLQVFRLNFVSSGEVLKVIMTMDYTPL
jgi:CheY-specific phosphatase CheX